MATRVLADKTAADQVWHTQGWAQRTGYDPTGLGSFGWGMLGGYTLAEVQRVPNLSADELLEFFDQARCVCQAALDQVTLDALHRQAPCQPWPHWTAYRTTKLFLLNAYEHTGEVKALRELWQTSEERVAAAGVARTANDRLVQAGGALARFPFCPALAEQGTGSPLEPDSQHRARAEMAERVRNSTP